ncbi:hypothetical protein RVY79_18695, partial [Chromohalobacter sp. HP20-39]
MKQQINWSAVELLKYQIDLVLREAVVGVKERDVAEPRSSDAQISGCLRPAIALEPIAADRDVVVV